MKTGIFICARLSSSRLPGKHLLPAAGLPIEAWLIKRCRHAFAGELATGDAVIAVAATTDSGDNRLEALEQYGAKIFRGDPDNIPLRHLQAAEHFGVDAVVSVEGDDILCAVEGMRAVYGGLLDGNEGMRTLDLPFGMNLCGYRTAFLDRLIRKEKRVMSETAWMQAMGVDEFPAVRFDIPGDGGDIRLTLDYEEDLELFRRILSDLGERIVSMSAREIVAHVRRRRLEGINAFRMDDYNDNTAREMREEGVVMPKAAGACDGTGQRLYKRAKQIIPGGTQLLSKRPEMYLPEGWPAYYSKARGAEVWDLDGRRYYDFTNMSVGACPLGYADPDVDAAVREAASKGNMCTLNAPEEVELAELLLEIHPWAGGVRYARGGGEAMTMAVRIARATTGRDKVAICGYSGWHDWYLAVNIGDSSSLDGHHLPGLDPAGTPRALKGTAETFQAGDLAALERIVKRHGDELAAVVMEPMRNHLPPPGYLERVKELTHSRGALLVFDEVSAGFRICCGGSHLVLGTSPDIAVLAKAISNGYPMAAVFGTRDAMAGAEKSFVSSTYWTDRVGPAAALACIRKYRALEAHKRQIAVGEKLLAGWKALGEKHGLPVEVGGIPPLAHFAIADAQGQAARTLYTKLMLEKGYLAGPGVYATWAHDDAMVDAYLAATDSAFLRIAEIGLSADALAAALAPCTVAHTGFRRLN